jgi:hypothetical protein
MLNGLGMKVVAGALLEKWLLLKRAANLTASLVASRAASLALSTKSRSVSQPTFCVGLGSILGLAVAALVPP